MCKCNPNIRTPYCGKIGCEWPKHPSLEQRPEPAKNEEEFIKGLLYKLAAVLGLNDRELWWLIDHDERIDQGEYERLMKQGRDIPDTSIVGPENTQRTEGYDPKDLRKKS